MNTHKTKYGVLIVTFLFGMLLLLSAFCGSEALRLAYAEGGIAEEYERSNVLDDLKGSRIGGKEFDPKDYASVAGKETQVLALVEFCYSSDPERQSDFGLYLYVYNPQKIRFQNNPQTNKANLSFGNSERYDKYPLQFLNASGAEGYEELFYKYKILLSEAQKKTALGQLSASERSYHLSEIELAAEGAGTASAIGVEKSFYYKGFVEGYGDGAGLTSQEEALEVLPLKVHHTTYRPMGDYHNGKQSQLNSCYFRMPEKYFAENGRIKSIECEWYEYNTKPILVTQDPYLYEKLHALHGGSNQSFSEDQNFLIMAWGNEDVDPVGGKAAVYLMYFSDVDVSGHFVTWDWDDWRIMEGGIDEEGYVDSFSAVFYAADSYEERFVSSEELEDAFRENSEILQGEQVNGFSLSLFTEYLNLNVGHTIGYNKKTIGKDEQFTTFWERTTKSLWQEWFGGYDVETFEDKYRAFVTSKDEDFDLTGTDEQISKRLGINVGDVADFKKEYDLAQRNDERLVLFRFSAGDYFAAPCTESYKPSSSDSGDLVDDVDVKYIRKEYTSYVAIEPVFLGFDIISVTVLNDLEEFTIPVVMSPQNVFPPVSPPLKEDYHTGCTTPTVFKIVLTVLVAIVAFFVVTLIIKYLDKAVDRLNKNKRE